jgi:hypothetical protein
MEAMKRGLPKKLLDLPLLEPARTMAAFSNPVYDRLFSARPHEAATWAFPLNADAFYSVRETVG